MALLSRSDTAFCRVLWAPGRLFTHSRDPEETRLQASPSGWAAPHQPRDATKHSEELTEFVPNGPFYDASSSLMLYLDFRARHVRGRSEKRAQTLLRAAEEQKQADLAFHLLQGSGQEHRSEVDLRSAAPQIQL